MIKTVAIVGAGFAGLSTAKVLTRFGFAVTVFEKAADVGGVWSASRRYPGLTTQNPRTTYALSDFPMPDSYPEWPSGEQVQAYLHAYAGHFGLLDKIMLETEVESAEFDEPSASWTLRTRFSTGRSIEQRFDYLIVCNGIFCTPQLPAYPGADAFRSHGGMLLHTSQFQQQDVRGKRVVVVGYGKSSCDVASALSTAGAEVTLVARTLTWKMPKLLGNLLNFKFLLLTRMGEALFEYLDLQGVERFLHGPGKRVRNAMLDSVEALVSWQLQLRKLGLHPDRPLESIARSTVSLASDGFFEQVAAGKLRVHKGVEIARLSAGEVALTDGTTLPADMVVCGTGFEQHVPFLGAALQRRVTDARGNFQLYRSMLPLDVPRLAFNGYNSSFFSQLNCEIGALWLAQYLLGGLPLPALAEQRREVERRLRWMEWRTEGKHAKGTNIIPFSLHHIDELLGDMGLPVPLVTRIKQWLLPVEPGDYRYVERALAQSFAGLREGDEKRAAAGDALLDLAAE